MTAKFGARVYFSDPKTVRMELTRLNKLGAYVVEKKPDGTHWQELVSARDGLELVAALDRARRGEFGGRVNKLKKRR